MEQKKIVLCDTNVIIEFYRNNKEIISQLRSIGQNNIAVSIITSGELIFGAINKRELQQIKKDIGSLTQIDIDHGICKQFLKLMDRYSLSHRISLPDAMIAATAIEHNCEFFTLNKKDFRFIDGLKLYG
jgi:predicted nucleic acid-binding protein